MAWIEKRRRSAEADDVDLLVAGGGEPNLAACDFEGARAELDVGRAAKPRPRLNARSENEAEWNVRNAMGWRWVGWRWVEGN